MIRKPPNRLTASLGTQICVGALLALAIALPMLQPTASDVLRLVALGAGWLGILAGLRRTAGGTSGGRLASVLVTALVLGLTGILTDGLANGFTGLYVLLFVHIGLNFRPGTSSALMPFAALNWWLTNEPITAFALARLPVAIGLWLVVGELLARMTAQNASMRAVLADRADRDPLTGLYNRHGLDDRLGRLGPGDSLLFLDLDHFKHVNDLLGHAAGDDVLSDLGRVVLAVLRPHDVAVRYGGEEVVLLLPDCDAAGADSFLERLTLGWMASHPELTFSAGVAAVGPQGAEVAVERADAALYAAKRAGRNRWLHAVDAPASGPVLLELGGPVGAGSG